MTDSGRLTGSREPDPSSTGSGPTGFDPGRALEVIRRVRDIDYWEGNGEDLIDWVTLGYTENGQGRRTHNRNWRPLP